MKATYEDVIAMLDRTYPLKAQVSWLYGSNDYLDGARPIDVLFKGEYDRVISALHVEWA